MPTSQTCSTRRKNSKSDLMPMIWRAQQIRLTLSNECCARSMGLSWCRSCKKQRRFRAARKLQTQLTQAIDDALKLLGVNASTHEIKRQVSRSPVVRFEDTDGSLDWIDQYGKERTISHHGFENRVSERRKKIRSP